MGSKRHRGRRPPLQPTRAPHVPPRARLHVWPHAGRASTVRATGRTRTARPGRAPCPAGAWEKRARYKISRSFYCWDFIFKCNGKYITGGKIPEVWASLWDNGVRLSQGERPARPWAGCRAGAGWSRAARGCEGLLLLPGARRGGHKGRPGRVLHLGRNNPRHQYRLGRTCWRAALWRGTWVSWWTTG